MADRPVPSMTASRGCRAEFPGVDAVGWLNADDFLLADGLARMDAALRAHPDWVAVTARGLLADEQGALGDEIATEPFVARSFRAACARSASPPA